LATKALTDAQLSQGHREMRMRCAMTVEILSTAAHLYEKSAHEKACSTAVGV